MATNTNTPGGWWEGLMANALKKGSDYQYSPALGTYRDPNPQSRTIGGATGIGTMPGSTGFERTRTAPTPMQTVLEAQRKIGQTVPSADTGEANRFANMKKGFGPGTNMPTQEEQQQQGGGGGGYASSGLNEVFAPLFKALDQQRNLANSRYAANAGQIKNIFGQLVGARTADIDTIDKAYQRLQEAAASRGADVLSGMESREAQRVSQNQAVLGSLGVGDLSTASGGPAAQAAQAAQDVEAMNQSNWAGLLSAMGATSQEIARSDITSYGYKQAEDIANLQAARENRLQDIETQKFGLQSQQAQAEWDYQQAQKAAAAAAAAAQAKAAAQAQAAAETQANKNLGYFLGNADPITQIVVTGMQSGFIDQTGAERIQDAYSQFVSNYAPQNNQWNANTAASAFLTSPYAGGLSTTEKRLVESAIRASF